MSETNITAFIDSHPTTLVDFLKNINTMTGNFWGIAVSAVFTIIVFAWIYNRTKDSTQAALLGGFGSFVFNLLLLYMGLLTGTGAIIWLGIPLLIMGFALASSATK